MDLGKSSTNKSDVGLIEGFFFFLNEVIIKFICPHGAFVTLQLQPMHLSA